MRIAISGAQCTGKTTFIQDFLDVWPMYKTTDKSYRDIIKENNLTHSSNTTQETQEKILDWMIAEQNKFSSSDDVIFDRCPLDNLVYTLWAYQKGTGISKEFVDDTIKKVKESMKTIDLILYIPADKCDFDIEADGFRDVDFQYRTEIDHIFKAMFYQYENNHQADVFFPKDNMPGILEICGDRYQRIQYLKENYLDEEGEIYGEEHSILSPEHISMFEQLIADQRKEIRKGNR